MIGWQELQELQELWEISLFELGNFWQTDWATVQFKRLGFVYLAVAILGAAFLLKIWNRFFRKRKSAALPAGQAGFYEHSGYVLERSDRLGRIASFLAHSFKIVLLLGGAVLLTALADPFTTQSGSIEMRESREIVYLKDASTSMAWRFKNYDQSRAEIVQDFQLKLIAQRREKYDRAAFFLFDTRARLMAHFTRDANSLWFSVDNAPLVITAPHNDQNPQWQGRFILKKFRAENNSGATNLHLGLAAVIKLFELKGAKNIKDRSVIIITDGAAEQDPEPQLQELKRKKIIPYLVFIDPDRELEAQFHGTSSEKLKLPDKLLKDVRRYGGDYFVAVDKNALEAIGQKLDRLHAVKFSTKNYSKENFIYRRFLVLAIWLIFLAVTLRLIFWMYQRVT